MKTNTHNHEKLKAYMRKRHAYQLAKKVEFQTVKPKAA